MPVSIARLVWYSQAYEKKSCLKLKAKSLKVFTSNYGNETGPARISALGYISRILQNLLAE